MVTCWERADQLALLYVIFLCVLSFFPYDILGQVWYLIVLIPDLCIIFYFQLILNIKFRNIASILSFDQQIDKIRYRFKKNLETNWTIHGIPGTRISI